RPSGGSSGRRLGSFAAAVHTDGHGAGMRRGAWVDLSPEGGERGGVTEGERVRVSSRRGPLEVPVRFDPSLRPGLAFMTLHFGDDVMTNILTIDATDPKSGTAEFKASAIRIDRIPSATPAKSAV